MKTRDWENVVFFPEVPRSPLPCPRDPNDPSLPPAPPHWRVSDTKTGRISVERHREQNLGRGTALSNNHEQAGGGGELSGSTAARRARGQRRRWSVHKGRGGPGTGPGMH